MVSKGLHRRDDTPEAASRESTDILSEYHRRSLAFNNTHHLPEEARARTIKARALAGRADVLARETARDDREFIRPARPGEPERRGADAAEQVDVAVWLEHHGVEPGDVDAPHVAGGQTSVRHASRQHLAAIGVDVGVDGHLACFSASLETGVGVQSVLADFVIRRLATDAQYSLISNPRKRYPSDTAATPVLPEPVIGSKMVPPAGQSFTSSRINSTGFCVACSRSSVGTVRTSKNPGRYVDDGVVEMSRGPLVPQTMYSHWARKRFATGRATTLFQGTMPR